MWPGVKIGVLCGTLTCGGSGESSKKRRNQKRRSQQTEDQGGRKGKEQSFSNVLWHEWSTSRLAEAAGEHAVVARVLKPIC